jgi:hypothetical protein
MSADATIYCTKCGSECPYEHYMCDVIEGTWCSDCFDSIRCEELHGEGCATKVFTTSGQDGRASYAQ